jgi:hypothetical protein
MKVLRSLAISALLTFAGSGAFAQTIDDDTKCGVLVAVTRDSSTGETAAKEAARYIEETMRAIDRLHGQGGKAEILPQMTEESRSSLVQTVMMRCHDRQAVTVADTAIETYEAVRSAGAEFGLDRSAKVTVRTKHSRAATPRRSSASSVRGQFAWHEL